LLSAQTHSAGHGPWLRRQLGPRAQRVRGPRPAWAHARGGSARRRLGTGPRATVGATAHRREDGDGRRRVHDGGCATATLSEASRRVRGSCRDDGSAHEAAVRMRGAGSSRRARQGSCRDARRAVLTAALCRCVGAARRVATDRSGPLVSDFRNKIHPEGN
jgi:hypothetical protein